MILIVVIVPRGDLPDFRGYQPGQVATIEDEGPANYRELAMSRSP